MTDPTDPRAPHWQDFSKVDDLPNDWSFEVLEWDDDPDEDELVDRGEAEVVRGDHRFVVTTWLVPRTNTHDRYWSVAYEATDQDGEDKLLSFHVSTTSAIVRNNLGYARDSLDGYGMTHILVRKHSEDDRETFEFPNEFLAEKAADLQTRAKMENEDRDYLVFVESEEEWEEKLELERTLEEADHAN